MALLPPAGPPTINVHQQKDDILFLGRKTANSPAACEDEGETFAARSAAILGETLAQLLRFFVIFASVALIILLIFIAQHL